MKVCELVHALKAIPDQEATVVIGEGEEPNVWLIMSGLAPRQISRVDDDHAVPGHSPAVEIV